MAKSVHATAFPVSEGYPYPIVKRLSQHCLTKGLSVLVLGCPGGGKSAMAVELAADLELKLVDVRLAQQDPSEIAGINVPDHQHRALLRYATDWVTVACAEPCLVFLDEINAAVTRLHQSVAYQIVLEKRIGPHVFHPQTVVMAAGNREEDEALAVAMSSALRNRFVHFTLRVDADAWIDWATRRNLSPDIIAYIAFRKEPGLFKMTGETAFPTPRSWAMAAQADGANLPALDRKRILAGCVGEAAASEWATFHAVYRQVDVDAILIQGKLPSLQNADPAFLYALTFSVVQLLRTRGLTTAQAPHLLALMEAPGYAAEFLPLLVRGIADTKAFQILSTSKIFERIRSRIITLLQATQGGALAQAA